jgi:hypothetical protein
MSVRKAPGHADAAAATQILLGGLAHDREIYGRAAR